MSNALRKNIRGAEKEKRNQVREAALNAGIRGVEAMEHVIANTPSSIVPGKPDRIDTGLMFDSVDAKVSEVGHKITVSVGWLNTKKKYFLVQDKGGRLRDISITGMFALRAGTRAMQREMEKVNVR